MGGGMVQPAPQMGMNQQQMAMQRQLEAAQAQAQQYQAQAQRLQQVRIQVQAVQLVDDFVTQETAALSNFAIVPNCTRKNDSY